MSRYTGPKCRLCRREGIKLFLKGARCDSPMCALVRRQQVPGQHGSSLRRKITSYGKQLREKQKVKRLYGVSENQFRRYYFEAEKRGQDTGTALLTFLERRLDNVIYRLGLYDSRAQARQNIGYGKILLNGKVVKTPSLLVKVGDSVTLSQPLVIVPKSVGFDSSWLNLDEKSGSGKIIKFPERDDIKDPIEEHLIVEYYSR